MAANLRLFDRVVIAQKNTGNILDIDSVEVAADIGRTRDRQTQMMGDSSLWVQSSRDTMRIPLMEDTHERLAFLMEDLECDCIGIALGEQHIGFFEGARPLVRPQNAPAGEIAPKVIQLTTGAKYADVQDSRDLIRGIPWEGTTTETGSLNDTGLTYDLMPGYRWGGRAWGTDQSSISPNITGTAPNVTQTDFARTRFPFPAWGATIRVDFPEQQTGDGIVRATDWDSNNLGTSSLGSSFTIPAKTWWLEIALWDVPAYPQLFIESAGDSWGVLEGEITSDCQTRASSPHWNETAIDLLAEDT